MNEIVNKPLVAEDKFMRKMHWRQKFEEVAGSRYVYVDKLDKACFQHEMTYGDFKDFPRGTASSKVLLDKAFNFAKIWNMMDIKVLLQWFIKFLIGSLLVLILQMVELKMRICQTKN